MSPVFYTAAPKCVCIRRLAGACHHRSFCEHGNQRVGRTPQRARPVQISWRSRWFCRSMSVQDSESRRFEQHLAEFFSSRSWPKVQELFFSGFLKSLKLFFRRFVLIASGTEIFWWVSLKIELFLATSRFHCHRSKKRTPTSEFFLAHENALNMTIFCA